MISIGESISTARKLKGFSQERLAELSKVNIRTIQRIESNENEPRGKTLTLICDVLEINVEEIKKSKKTSKKMGEQITGWIFLIGLNFLLMAVFGFLFLDSNANWNSRLGGLLLSIFIPVTIVFFTKEMSGFERMIKFGFGLIIYIILSLITIGFQLAIVLFIPFLLIALAILYFGNNLIKHKN